MKILVTGAAGFIGSHVVDLLLAQGHSVWCVDNLSTGKRKNLPKDIEFAQVNVGSWWDLVSEFVDCEPDAVIHLAAQPSICESLDNPVRDGYVNVMGTLNVIRAAQKIGVKRLVFSSTSAVYDEQPDSRPLKEDHVRIPRSPYGISKLAAESYVRTLMPDTGTVLRFGNVYGPRQVPLGENQVIPRMIRHFEKGTPVFIHGDGMQERDFVYVEDVAKACVLALDHTPGVYNIASGKAISIVGVARLLEGIYDLKAYNWSYDEQQDERFKVELNINKAMNELGWSPQVDLLTGLRRTVEWWKTQP